MSVQQATARAGANIALVKYWGKRDSRLNLPAAGSLSITLADLETRTTVRPDASLECDRFTLDGARQPADRVGAVLDRVRELAGSDLYCEIDSHNNFPTGAELAGSDLYCEIDSHNNFPTGAGLASSASGFAALVTAADAAFGLGLSPDRLSELARRGSGSAARSIFGGFVEMAAGERDDGADAVAHGLLDAAAWPLEVVVAVTDRQSKSVGSREGMQRTMRSSPYYPAWVESVAGDLEQARAAIERRDFEALAEVAEHSALKMHASMLAARPGLIYWNPATLACIEAVRNLRANGTGVFFTIDAGPQVKAVCLPGQAAGVAERLRQQSGVAAVSVTPLGGGAERIRSR